MSVSVIISTYNSPDWLEKVLWGYQCQSFRDFELLVADDGSGEPTRALINDMRQQVSYPLKHIWHEDNGFQKCTILNKALLAAAYDYIVFSDGDCIPRKDFLEIHNSKKKPGHYLSGGYFKLPMNISKLITKEDISQQLCFNLQWLYQHGLKSSFKTNKLKAGKFKQWLLNTFTPTKASWNGHNASGWKEDIISVNGFDERMKYGSEDREMGERLKNKSIKGIQVRYSAICVHLDHDRSYVNEADLKMNAEIFELTQKNQLAWTDYGIVKKE